LSAGDKKAAKKPLNLSKIGLKISTRKLNIEY